MKYFSMFSGIGGFELGIKKATNNTWECVGFSEINKYAKETYKSHFPQHTNYGDCTAIQPENYSYIENGMHITVHPFS